MSVLSLSTEQFQRLLHSLVVAPSALFNLCVPHINYCIYIHRVIIILEEVILVISPWAVLNITSRFVPRQVSNLAWGISLCGGSYLSLESMLYRVGEVVYLAKYLLCKYEGMCVLFLWSQDSCNRLWHHIFSFSISSYFLWLSETSPEIPVPLALTGLWVHL